MPTLLAPHPPPSLMELPNAPFFGRTFEEYTRCFALDPVALRRRAVLDVAAGPSSFTAEAVQRDIDAVAVDPRYGSPAGQLAAQVRVDSHRMFAQLRAKPRRSLAALAALEATRHAAARRFLADYDNNARHGRYVRASLPALPFLDQSFSLVLCAHLLFISPLDYAWHLAACRELVRVSAGEVRIHPVGGVGGKLYGELERLRGELLAEGVRSDVVPVAGAFSAGGKHMLVLRRDRTVRRAVAA